ncbi:hypothetical protein MBAV_006484 [Candidatus Magnetobacterium bavaricum]|uniref:Uncharacterized protein n=1 Tax=Candidatus Magnetobacterium bavaricum TaxID=29290 RepID=A0A0F3GHJ4_9BACT|nr:hypothetical protein MBAV_006484 [Candidatus Magnetobacterium bavaricum]
MSNLLKGNYHVAENSNTSIGSEEKSLTDIFENEALMKLGGSIAFVMKSNTFVWDDDETTK